MENKLLVKAVIDEAGYRQGFKIKDIRLEVKPGEILLITGRSGSGKTTLLKTLQGIIRLFNGYYRGRIIIDGKPIEEYTPGELYRISTYIPQEPWYGIIGYTVYTEYCLALSQSGIKCREEDLARYGLERLSSRTTYNLSAGEYQRLLWATTLDRRAKILFLDEPFVYLDEDSRLLIFKLVEEYLEENGSIIVVDHQYDKWSSLEPKTIVLDKGRPVYYGGYNEKTISRHLADTRRFSRRERRIGERILYTVNIWHRYPSQKDALLKGINIELHRGEIIGVTGPNGSGKTTLLKILAGLEKPVKGRVVRNGSVIYVPEEPLLYYTYPTPREELSSTRDLGEFTKYIEIFDLGDLLDKPVRMLSTGERRRIALLASFIKGYDIFLLDEPSGGLDNYNVEVLMDMIDYMASKRRGIIVSSHDHRLQPLYDKLYVVEGGVLKRVF